MRANFGDAPFAYTDGSSHCVESLTESQRDMREYFSVLPFHLDSDCNSDSTESISQVSQPSPDTVLTPSVSQSECRVAALVQPLNG